VSRPLAEIVDEVRRLVASSAREVTLLGQNIDAYRDPTGHRFDTLLRQVAAVPALSRLRFTTGHPNDFTEAMAQAMADAPNICEHLHLPAQCGSDAILKGMYRGYTRARYLEKIAMVRKKIPDLTLTTDLIVGFPGESEEDFEQTLALVHEADFDSAFVFSYSVRPGTPAAPWPDSVPEADKRRRLLRLIEEVRVVALRRISRFVGRRMQVLVEGPSRTDSGVWTGRIRHNSVVNFVGQASPGELVMVDIERAQNGFSLWGRLAAG
jgi:tRNA-2-methylthio-N6-dimethylallyladenosine synthase